jgi:hypothetical protein
MDADWSVELGSDDPVLEFPWVDESGRLTYVDLKAHPERIVDVSEAQASPELADFLGALNAPTSTLLTAKCDLWTTNELTEQEKYYQAKIKFCSYVDILFVEEADRRVFAKHEEFVKSLARVVSNSEAAGRPLAVVAEFIVRRCWFHSASGSASTVGGSAGELQEGFYVTFYLFGYGAEEEEGRRCWRLGLQQVNRVLARMAA